MQWFGLESYEKFLAMFHSWRRRLVPLRR